MLEESEITDKDYFQIFETNPLGSAILNELVGRFYDIRSFDPTNQFNTAYREGGRQVLRYILSRLMSAQDNDDDDNNDND